MTGRILPVFVLIHVSPILSLVTPKVAENTTTITYKGDTVYIQCPITKQITFPDWRGPPDDFLYYQGGTQRFNPKLGEKLDRVSIDTNNKTLVVNNTYLNDTGTYRCVKTDGLYVYAGYNDVTVRIQAQEPEISASVQLDDKGVRVSEGHEVTVTCISRGGYPAPTVAWYKEATSQPLNRTDKGSLDADGTFIVTLNHTFTAQRQDDRTYLVCHSYWPIPPEDLKLNNFTLYLNLQPVQPRVVQTTAVVAENDVTVECRTNGSRPAATISWTYLGKTYMPTPVLFNDTETQTYTTVSVFRRHVSATDNGQTVECRVSHMALDNDLVAFTSLNVEFAPRTVSINKTTENITANGMSPLTITCTSGTSNPVSDIIWHKGNIKNDLPTFVDSSGEYGGQVRTSTIRVYPTRDNDGATVRCAARYNATGQHEVSSSVVIDNIIYPPVIADIHDKDVVEGDSVTLPCHASSKPPARFIWRKGSFEVTRGQGSTAYNGLNYTIQNTSRSQAGTYTCNAENQLQSSDHKQTQLIVLYPPDITVVVVNTTVNSSGTNVTCEASGVPKNYTYESWEHTWNGHVVTRPKALPAGKVLTLTNLSYADSGVYTCRASNGVKNISRGAGTLLVKSPPVLVGDVANTLELKASGQLTKAITVSFQYYSNVGRGSVTFQKTNSTGQEDVGDDQLRDADISLPVFGTEIKTRGTEATINFTVVNMSQFGGYDVFVTNEMASVRFSLVIQPLGPPEPPVLVNSTILDHHSVVIRWISGFPNGLNQTFVIQLTTNNITWLNITQYGGVIYPKTHSKTVANLASGQLYFVRMLAFNAKGESELTRTSSFKTTVLPDPPTSSPIGIIAGGAGGGVVAAAVVIVIIVIVRRRKGAGMPGIAKDKDELVMSSNLNEGYDDRDLEVINRLYETAGPRESETAVGASTSKPVPRTDVENIYAKVNKKSEVVYAMPDKQKGKKLERQQNQKGIKSQKDGKKKNKDDKNKNQPGDVYENAPSAMSGNSSSLQSGESVYEDTCISAPSEKKTPTGNDGLLYADLDFAPKKKGPTKIIGIEDRCEYTTIDLTKKAQPLPDSDDEDKTNP